MPPKITIITALYNDAAHIAATIESVLSQDYPNLEYIIIDGKSSDGSTEIAQSYLAPQKHLPHRVTRLVSEKDSGISEAFNKGLKLATGDYVNFQGASDILDSKSALSELFWGVKSESYDLIFGRIKRVSADDKNEIRYFSKHYKNFKFSSLLWKMSIPHQALFTHKRFFEKYGDFRRDKIFSMDYEQLLRAYKERESLKILHKNVFVSRWKEGGVGLGQTPKILREYHDNRVSNRVAPGWILRLIYLWSLFKFYAKKIILRRPE